MKPIIIDITDMSDSKEVYESRPSIICSVFIYFVFAMILIAILWMCLGRIDVVVKSEGILRPNDQVSTVVNEYNGSIEKVNIEDGDYVKKGDILYTIEHTELIAEKDYLEGQIKDVTNTIDLLEKYKDSVKEGKNYFEDTPEEEEYYTKFLSYFINYKMAEKGLNYTEEDRKMNLELVTRQIKEAKEDKSNINSLKESIKKGKNLFLKSGNQLEYYNLYNKYKSDYDSLNLQYDRKKLEIDLSTTEEGIVNSIDYYNKKLDGLNTLQQSILTGVSQFVGTTSYSMQYEDFRTKLSQLETDYSQAKEDYDINLELKDYGVTDWEVKQSKIAMDKAYNAIGSYKTNYLADIKNQISELEKTKKELDLAKDNTLTQDELYENNEIDRKAAIANFHLQYITDLDSKSSALEGNIINLEGNKNSLVLQGEKDYVYEEKSNGEKSGNLVSLKNIELQNTINSIDTFHKQRKELEINLEKLNDTIDSSIMTAQMDGIINSSLELVEGDVLSAGREVLTIIPDDNSKYKVNIYVSNSDIGKMKEGMDIKCNIYALPNKEYGYLTGEISKISKDIKIDNENSAGYYLVEATIDNKKLYDYSGKEAELKAGMGCQAQIITGNKNIFTYVLEKLDFLKS